MYVSARVCVCVCVCVQAWGSEWLWVGKARFFPLVSRRLLSCFVYAVESVNFVFRHVGIVRQTAQCFSHASTFLGCGYDVQWNRRRWRLLCHEGPSKRTAWTQKVGSAKLQRAKGGGGKRGTFAQGWSAKRPKEAVLAPLGDRESVCLCGCVGMREYAAYVCGVDEKRVGLVLERGTSVCSAQTRR